jgi:hypothetical protein
VQVNRHHPLHAYLVDHYPVAEEFLNRVATLGAG